MALWVFHSKPRQPFLGIQYANTICTTFWSSFPNENSVCYLYTRHALLKGADDIHGLTASITWGYKQLQSKMLESWSLWSWLFPWLVEMLWWASGGIVSSSGTQGIFSSLKSQKLPDAVWCPLSTPERYLLNHFYDKYISIQYVHMNLKVLLSAQ